MLTCNRSALLIITPGRLRNLFPVYVYMKGGIYVLAYPVLQYEVK